MKISGLKCIECGKEYGEKEVEYTCTSCGCNLDVVYDYAEIKKGFSRATLAANRDFSAWRYIPVLPIKSDLSSNPGIFPKLAVGWTPMYRAKNLSKKYGFKNLYLKDDGKNPSASFKDRASSLVVVKGQELGVKVFTTASTGNAGCALACMCANLQLPCVIFVPKTAPRAKIAQLMLFGAKVVAVNGTYDEAFDLSLKVADEFGWYCRSTGYNAYTREGKKTAALEICEQLGWNVPDKVFVSVGDGNIISGTWKGFKDFYNLGLIDRLPQIIAVQSEKSNAISKAWQRVAGKPNAKIVVEPVRATTIADSISVDLPRDGVAAVKAVLESGGFAIEVSDEEILGAIRIVAENEGVFAEPAASTAFAGFAKAIQQKKIKDGETAVCMITGNGLKDVESAMKVAGEPVLIEPDIEAVKKLKLN
jgi:threonine synthase